VSILAILCYDTWATHEQPSKVFAEIIVSEKLLLVSLHCSMARARARVQAVVECPIGLSQGLSTPSTDARPRALGNSVPRDTSHKAQMDRMVGTVLPGEAGSGDRGGP